MMSKIDQRTFALVYAGLITLALLAGAFYFAKSYSLEVETANLRERLYEFEVIAQNSSGENLSQCFEFAPPLAGEIDFSEWSAFEAEGFRFLHPDSVSIQIPTSAPDDLKNYELAYSESDDIRASMSVFALKDGSYSPPHFNAAVYEPISNRWYAPLDFQEESLSNFVPCFPNSINQEGGYPVYLTGRNDSGVVNLTYSTILRHENLDVFYEPLVIEISGTYSDENRAEFGSFRTILENIIRTLEPVAAS